MSEEHFGTRLAIVIPYFQREAGILRRAVESVFGQTGAGPTTIIIVDDGSPVPAQVDVGDLAGRADHRIIVARQPNAGPGAARNHGIELVPPGTPYVAFLDSDNVWSDSHVRNAVSALDAGSDFYFSDARRESEADTVFALNPPGVLPEDLGPVLSEPSVHVYEGDIQLAVLANLVRTSTVAYRFTRFPDVRFRTDLSCAEDLHFWLTLGRRASSVAVSLEREALSGAGVNLFQSVPQKSVGRVRVLGDQIDFFDHALALPDLSDRALELASRYRGDLYRHMGDELVHHLLRGRIALARTAVRRHPESVGSVVRAIRRRTGNAGRRQVRRLKRRLTSIR